MFTAFEQFMGTPAYMSPEQAQGPAKRRARFWPGWGKHPRMQSQAATLGGSGQKEVIRLAPRGNVNSLAWTPDGKRLVYAKETPGKEKKEPAQTAIWSTAVDTGESVKLKFSQPRLSDIAINPDGRQIAFQTGSIGDTVDVWIMEGMLPKQSAQKAGPRPKIIAQSSPARAKTNIPVGEISGPNHSISDRQFGLSATLPTGWTIKSANRNDTYGNHIEFTAPDTPDDAKAFVNYRATKPGGLATFYGENWTYPNSNTWTPVSATGAPSARYDQPAVWTG